MALQQTQTGKPDRPAKRATGASPTPGEPGEGAQAERPTVRAKARYVRTSPQKARLVADQVRGMALPEAQDLLRFSPRGVAVDFQKLLGSAAANAENNHELVADELVITELRVDAGPTLKRWRPRARGRADRIDKRTCHLSVVLTPADE